MGLLIPPRQDALTVEDTSSEWPAEMRIAALFDPGTGSWDPQAALARCEIDDF